MREIPEISDAMVAYPAINEGTEWVPPHEEIPKEFTFPARNKWTDFFNNLFYKGVKNLALIPKEGVDPSKAWKALCALKGTYGLKHEHKTAAFAFLASEWFEDVKYEEADPKA